MKNMRTFFFLLTAVLAAVLISCSEPPFYAESKPIEKEGWQAEKAYQYSPEITDTTALYNVFFTLRNTGEYPYSNLWLFVTRTSPNGITDTDTIECPLAYNSGKWIGKSAGGFYDNIILYQQNQRFKTSGTYTYNIQQGMRDSLLKDVSDIGLRIDKVKANN